MDLLHARTACTTAASPWPSQFQKTSVKAIFIAIRRIRRGMERGQPEVGTKMEYALVRFRPTAKRTRWAFTSANSARGTASARDVHLRPGIGDSNPLHPSLRVSRLRIPGAHTGAAAICLAQGLEHPGIRDPQRSQECRKGVTHCKHGGTGLSDKFCPPIWGEMRIRGLGREPPDILARYAPLNREAEVVGRASRLPHRASRPRWNVGGQDTPMAGETPAPLPGDSGAVAAPQMQPLSDFGFRPSFGLRVSVFGFPGCSPDNFNLCPGHPRLYPPDA
jgi:hypothetical protein